MKGFNNIMGLLSSWNTFKGTHPKAANFITAVGQRGVDVGSVIEVSVTYPNGEKLESSIRVQESDAQLIAQLKNMK